MTGPRMNRPINKPRFEGGIMSAIDAPPLARTVPPNRPARKRRAMRADREGARAQPTVSATNAMFVP